MSNWYYVDGSDRVGPVTEEKLSTLLLDNTLNSESYIWKAGFDNWQKFCDVEELYHLLNQDEAALPIMQDDPTESESESDTQKPIVAQKEEEVAEEVAEEVHQTYNEPKNGDKTNPFFNLNNTLNNKKQVAFDQLDEDHKVFMIKIGQDRGLNEVEYGPFSIKELKRAFLEQRINEKTYIFTPEMDTWTFLGDTELYQLISMALPPVIQEEDRRLKTRRPFMARIIYHDNTILFEGICRDISIGGLQVLTTAQNINVGDEVTLNVHPDNTDHSFTAKGVVVRMMDDMRGLSLRFKDLSSEASEAIDAYIHNN